MTFKTLFATVSTAALLATPLAAQESGSQIDRAGTPSEEVVSGDEDTVISNEEQGVGPRELGNRRVGDFQYDDSSAAADDSPFMIGEVQDVTPDSSAWMSDAQSRWHGTSVETINGRPLGDVKDVFVDDGGVTYAEVELKEDLGIDSADSVFVAFGADVGDMDGIQLPQTEDEFMTELAERTGLEPRATE